MSSKEKLQDFAGALTSATFAPDNYHPWGYVTYESNMADLKQLWSEIQPKLKNNIDKCEFHRSQTPGRVYCFQSG